VKLSLFLSPPLEKRVFFLFDDKLAVPLFPWPSFAKHREGFFSCSRLLSLLLFRFALQIVLTFALFLIENRLFSFPLQKRNLFLFCFFGPGKTPYFFKNLYPSLTRKDVTFFLPQSLWQYAFFSRGVLSFSFREVETGEEFFHFR